MSVKEIELAITQLPSTEVSHLVVWLEDYHHKLWDQQIENDLDAGRLDDLIAKAEEDYKAGLARPL